jgi:hypothetical protein
MKKLIVLGGLLLSLFGKAMAFGDEYAVSRIAPHLLKNANAVLRLEEMRLEINSTRETVLKNHYVITILNEAGEEWAEFFEHYDKHREINSVEGVLYDASGKQLKKVKKKDLEDLSGVSDISLMDDNRIKRHNFYHKVYPYTIEYYVEITNKETLFFPRWAPQADENISVEKSTMSIECNAEYKFRYKAFQYKGEPVITQQKNRTITTWTARDMPSIKREPFAPMWHELTTVVIFGPSDFQMDDYKGNMSSWQDFGKFVHTLKQGRDQLPDNVKQAVRKINSETTDPKEKIARLYQFMQKATRYISIQLGIGGWQPFDANFVASKGYGDCKALTNYMYSLLKEAGIPSYYALIRAGRNANYITEDFPSQQFNHVILCVPLQKDTVWLECTSQTMPSGYLGDFTCDRYALLIDENGGRLVRTPKYGVSDNLQHRKIKSVLQEDANLVASISTNYSGLQQDDIHGLINSLSKEKVKEYLHQQLDFPTYDITQFNYAEKKGDIPAIHEALEIKVSNYATITGKRLFITPNIMTKSSRKFSAVEERKYDIVLNSEYTDIDSVEIELPKGYEAESLPQPVSISSKFGKYSSSTKLSGNKLVYYRAIEQYSGRFSAKEYPDLVKYYDAIYKADRNKVVLVKNEQALKGF